MTIGCGSDTSVKVYYQPFDDSILKCGVPEPESPAGQCGTCQIDGTCKETDRLTTWCNPSTAFNDSCMKTSEIGNSLCVPKDFSENMVSYCPQLGALKATSAERIGDYKIGQGAPQCDIRENAARLNCCYDLKQPLSLKDKNLTMRVIKGIQTIETKDLGGTPYDTPLMTNDDMKIVERFLDCGGVGETCCEGDVCRDDSLACKDAYGSKKCELTTPFCSDLRAVASVTPIGQCVDDPHWSWDGIQRLACAPTNETPIKYWVCDMKNSCPEGLKMMPCRWDGLEAWY